MYNFIDENGVVWKSLDDEGLPNVLVGSNMTFRYVGGNVIKINKKGYICPSYNGKRKNLTPRIIFHKYFGDNEGWVNLSIISDFYSNYACNPELGLIRNDITGLILRNIVDVDGYIQIGFHNKGQIKQLFVHRIVAFIKWRILLEDYSVDINHKNENKSDNRACNLLINTRKENITWSKINKSGYTNINKTDNGKYFYRITKHGFITDVVAYEWRCWAMPIAGIEDLKEGFREPINRHKEWMSLAIVGCPNYVINQHKGVILNLTKCSIENHTENDYIIGWIQTNKNTGKSYRRVELTNYKGKGQLFLLHILLAKCFIHNPDPKKYIKVDHDDNDGLNNSLENLSWTIQRHNITKDTKRKGDYPNVMKTHESINFYVSFISNSFDTLEECIADMKRVYPLLGLEYVDRNELRKEHGYE